MGVVSVIFRLWFAIVSNSKRVLIIVTRNKMNSTLELEPLVCLPGYGGKRNSQKFRKKGCCVLPKLWKCCFRPSEHDHSGTVTVRLLPDEYGRFGFKVKGGSGQNLPVLVTRVVANSPADRCLPRLKEGDEILMINGQSVTGLSHEQVVEQIQSSLQSPSGELMLTIYPNVCTESKEEYTPELSPDVCPNIPCSDALEESVLAMKNGLESGAAIVQFEKLYRKKAGMTMNVAKLPENIHKNRYKDISPYDSTRVVLHSSKRGCYINASHVNIKIPKMGITNKYIATQGPLPHTCIDFWQMIWEQHSQLIVMVTTLRERGRTKCHKYWPDLYETVLYGKFQITSLQEHENPSFVSRDFILINTETNEEHHIRHMQYMTWPDHGVPNDATDFLNFIVQVRQNRTSVDPVIVHCSAGIGRTGVLILMETAMCHIEANEPVYPLDAVRTMREQRAMLIQTPSQYKFTCEAILKVYTDGVVKPLAQYKR